MNMFNDSGFDKLYINPVSFKTRLANHSVDATSIVSDIPTSSTQAVMPVPVNTEVVNNNTMPQSKGSIIIQGLFMLILTIGLVATIHHLNKKLKEEDRNQ